MSIERAQLAHIQSLLNDQDCVLLLGPKQVGKTTLSRRLSAENGYASLYLDFDCEQDRKVFDNPDSFFAEHTGKLIIFDEAQTVAHLFPSLKRVIDLPSKIGISRTKILLLGSASFNLEQLAAQHIGGRFAYAELCPFQLFELFHSKGMTAEDSESEEVTTQVNFTNDRDSSDCIVQKLWLRGGFPKSYLAHNDEISMAWRENFSKSFLEGFFPNNYRELRKDKVKNFWAHFALRQGRDFNLNTYARDLNITREAVELLSAFLEKSCLIRQLLPWFSNKEKRLNKQRRAYIRDSGLLHAQLKLTTQQALISSECCGMSWECFVIEALIQAAGSANAYFFRNEACDELDLVLEFSANKCWAIEVKLSKNPTLEPGSFRAFKAIKAERLIVVHPGQVSYKKDGEIPVSFLALPDAIQAVRDRA